MTSVLVEQKQTDVMLLILLGNQLSHNVLLGILLVDLASDGHRILYKQEMLK